VIHYRYDSVHRLESAGLETELSRGLAAEVADAAWMLGRQWQLGELQGEDASSPVRVSFTLFLTPMKLVSDADETDARLTPPEALVESEPEEWWTVGRRVRIGRSVTASARDEIEFPEDDAHLLLANLPLPYRALEGTGYDGRELWRHREKYDLKEEWFGPDIPADPDDFWDSAEFTYGADFTAENVTLELRRHDGGDLDWFSVDADRPLEPSLVTGEQMTTLCSRLRYPGAPTPRWWEIEDAGLDIGGQAPYRAHFATLLLIKLLASHADDWFTFSVDTVPGTVLTLGKVQVTDSFGDEWNLEPPTDGWSLFTVDGLDNLSDPPLDFRSLLVWPTVATPLIGPLQDEIILGVDEEAGRLWAAERRIAGRDVATDPVEVRVPDRIDAGERRRFRYQPAPPVPAHWHPYVLDPASLQRRFVQGRLADLSGPEAVFAPVPKVDLLYDRKRPEGEPVHQIQPSAVPRTGLRLERRYVLGRRADGTPVLWSERRRAPLAAPPALPLHFDTLEAASTAAE
jgi:hypothetical protein